MKRVSAAVAAVVVSVLAGCADQNQDMQRYPQPLFVTRAPRKPAPRIVTPPPPPPQQQQYAAAEPGWMPAGGLRRQWTDIVIHHSGGASGGAKSFDAYHRNVRHWDELGYHFVIGNGTDTGDGQVEVGPRWTKQKHGAHCKTPDNHYNDYGIGICLVGDFDKTYPTQAQLRSLNKLLAFLTQTCNIPAARINTHKGVTNKTACPGKNLSLTAIKRDLAASGSAYTFAR